MTRRSLEDWRREVFKSQLPEMTPAVKVLCLYLAEHARRDDLRISVPREQIADALGIHKARVAERLKRAVDAEFLHSVSKGFLGHTAVYRATFPAPVCVQQTGTHMRPAKADTYRSAPQDALIPDPERESEIYAYRSAGRHYTGTSLGPATIGEDRATEDRDVGIDEKAATSPVVSSLRRGATEDREATA